MVTTLLIRNLDDVFGEGDPQRRRAAIDEIFTEDAVFYEPGAVHRGRDEIDMHDRCLLFTSFLTGFIANRPPKLNFRSMRMSLDH
jgi:hypothetical protein